ncbi:MAG: class I SAM-dependent methyltransferase [Candidatus Omnitrophota bacterium]
MIKKVIRKGVKKAVNTKPGLKFFKTLASEIRVENAWALEADNPSIVRSFKKFSGVSVPRKIEGFEDLAFLFTSWRGNRGIVRLDFDEAAYLFKLVRSLNNPQCVEIGRFKGGSTLLIASAMRGGMLFSIDLHVTLDKEGAQRDSELEEMLRKTDLNGRVSLIVGDSRTYDNRSLSVDFLWIDGDHSYQGVRADFEHWIGALRPGGHVLFHDDHIGQPGVQRFMRELEREKSLDKINAPGSMAHFVKR